MGSAARARVRPGKSWIGTSGYAYPSWRGRFYPATLPARAWLGFASQQFQSIEINRSFYALLSPAACQAWAEQTPADFVFSLKGSRFITHIKKLSDVERALANFFASGPLRFGRKLGPIVWQLPASTRFQPERLTRFFAGLPRTTQAAAELARGHDARVKHGVYLTPGRSRALRYVLEPRHESFLVPECAALLREHHIALAVSDSPTWPSAEEPTTDFMYLRLHGSRRLYASAYSASELLRFARQLRAFRRGALPRDLRRVERVALPRIPRDVYVYFDNDAEAHAARDAMRLIALTAPAHAARATSEQLEQSHAT